MNFKPVTFLMFILLNLSFVSYLFSQPPTPHELEIPLDGGAGFLLAAGVAYGIYRFRKNRKS